MDKIEQLKAYFINKGIKQQEIASTLGLKKSFVSELLNGKRSIGYETAHKLSSQYPDLNIDWLMTGEGEMLRTDPGAGAVSDVEALRRRIAELEATVERQNRVIDALTGSGCKQIG